MKNNMFLIVLCCALFLFLSLANADDKESAINYDALEYEDEEIDIFAEMRKEEEAKRKLFEDDTDIFAEIQKDYEDNLRDTLALEQSVKSGLSKDAASFKENSSLSKKHDIPLSVVESDPSRVKEIDRLAAFDLPNLNKENPALATFLMNPVNAALVQDNIEQLKEIERAFAARHKYKQQKLERQRDNTIVIAMFVLLLCFVSWLFLKRFTHTGWKRVTIVSMASFWLIVFTTILFSSSYNFMAAFLIASGYTSLIPIGLAAVYKIAIWTKSGFSQT